MKNLRTLGTGATIATFAVMAVSGGALFFGLRGGNLKLIHEYVGATMIIACILHIFVNFKVTMNYFKGLKGVIITAFIVIFIALCFVSFGGGNGKAPVAKMLYPAVLNLSVSEAKSAFKTNEAKFSEFLQSANLQNDNQNLSISEFAKANNIKADEVVRAILPAMKPMKK